MKLIIKVLKTICITIFTWFIFHSVYIIYDGLSDNEAQADVAVIPGNKFNEDGTLSERLKNVSKLGLNCTKIIASKK